MIDSIEIKNFTLFSDEKIDFSPQLNIIVGENGLGKSHLLKLPYASIMPCLLETKNSNTSPPTKTELRKSIAEKLQGVFKPDYLGRLSKQKKGNSRTGVTLKGIKDKINLSYSFSSSSKKEVEIDNLPEQRINGSPVFLPTRELLTIYPGFVPLYDQYHLEFPETWRDTCLLLGAPLKKGPREKEMKDLLEPIENAIGGSIYLDKSGKFYLEQSNSGNMEIYLVAEGFRKLAMLAMLIANGTITGEKILFWDEPEANLNPKLIKQVAKVIIELVKNDIQIHLATHSLYLMRELEILLNKKENKNVKTKIIGLKKDKNNEVILEQADNFDSIQHITSLDEELLQSDRYMGLDNDNCS